MVVIRLSRGGSKKRPFYNFVVADKRSRRDGRYIERIGFYKPGASEGEESLRLAFDRLEYWTGVGAQVSPTVKRLVKLAKAGKTTGQAQATPAAPAAAAEKSDESGESKATADAQQTEEAAAGDENADAAATE